MTRLLKKKSTNIFIYAYDCTSFKILTLLSKPLHLKLVLMSFSNVQLILHDWSPKTSILDPKP